MEVVNFEETELRLGIGFPAGDNKAKNSTTNANGKRGFTQTHHRHVDLKLMNMATADENMDPSETHHHVDVKKEKNNLLRGGSINDPLVKPLAKAQVVGWPPVRSFRKNNIQLISVQKRCMTNEENNEKAMMSSPSGGANFVKVSLDGAPYLRKVDLNIYNSYQDLSDALAKMFSSFTIGNCGSEGLMDFMNESKLMDLLNGSDHVPTYEDKDGDWMVVGDVPWEMFVGSCKRLRIMKGTEAIGLAPRAMEKCKSRS